MGAAVLLPFDARFERRATSRTYERDKGRLLNFRLVFYSKQAGRAVRHFRQADQEGHPTATDKKAARRLLRRAAGILIDAKAHFCAGMPSGA